jgi:phosphatidylglycerol:prolipoprotein diacylglycerol transferase
MHPELFRIPFTELTIKTYGLMMVIGFITAISIIRRLSRKITPDPQMITNAALYSLIAGVVGARLFFVVHYFDRFSSDLPSVIAIWDGGLELLGGVLSAIAVIAIYLKYHKLPIRQYLDILAIGLMAALMFGRIGCFCSGCCFGKPTDVPWAVRFPYGSHAYQSQIRPNPARNRSQPHLQLPDEFFGYVGEDGVLYPGLKPKDKLTPEQLELVTKGPYRCKAVHPTQLYSSANAAVICLLLYLFWRRAQAAQKKPDSKPLLTAPGTVFALMFIFYGATRFCIEYLRDDNPFEYFGLTISQNLGIVLIVFGLIMLVGFAAFHSRRKSQRQGAS